MRTRLLLVSLLLLCSHGLLQADLVNGRVRSIIGDAVLVPPGGKPQTVTSDTVIPPGSRIFTKNNTDMIIEWVPGAYSILFPNSSVSVGTLAYSKPDGGEANRKVSIGLLKGSVFSHLAHNDGTSDFRVKTPSGVAAARGTDWVIGYVGGKVKVWTLADTVLAILPSGKVITVEELYGYLYGNAHPVRYRESEFERILNALRAAGLSIVLQDINNPNVPLYPGTHTDGYVVTFAPPDGNGFQFFIPIWVGDRDNHFPRRPLPIVPSASH